MHQAGSRRKNLALAGAAMMKCVVNQREDVRAMNIVDRRERVALEAKRRPRKTQRFDETFEAELAKDGVGAFQRGAEALRFLGRVFKHLALVERTHHETRRSACRGELGQALRLTRALVIPNVEWIEGVDRANGEFLSHGLRADAASRIDISYAVGADVVAQFDRTAPA